MGLSFQVFACHLRQFVGELDDRRNAERTTPVVIQVTELVREHLNLRRVESSLVVVNHVVAGRRDASLTCVLTDQIEIVAGKNVNSQLVML